MNNSYNRMVRNSALVSATKIASASNSTISDWKHLFKLALECVSYIQTEEELDRNSIISNAMFVLMFKHRVYGDEEPMLGDMYSKLYYSAFIKQYSFDICRGSEEYKLQQLKKWPELEALMMADLEAKTVS